MNTRIAASVPSMSPSRPIRSLPISLSITAGTTSEGNPIARTFRAAVRIAHPPFWKRLALLFDCFNRGPGGHDAPKHEQDVDIEEIVGHWRCRDILGNVTFGAEEVARRHRGEEMAVAVYNVMLTIGACDSPVRAQVWQDRHLLPLMSIW
jgi:hypothetical protein